MSYDFQSHAQREQYESLKNAGFEYELTEPDGTIRMVRRERLYDSTRIVEASSVDPDGTIESRYNH